MTNKYSPAFKGRYRPKHSGRKSNPGLMERGWNRSKGMDPHAKFLCRSQRMVMMALEKSKTHKAFAYKASGIGTFFP
ncbi:hypothetical protein RRG08_041415 [Elysia crispata]|uniref:Uncharacterized protein n=1 Tax=Elysia crispata TaxID=231223 RepID=A0AAE0XRK2_9GAST|nr:hypothetical protein RRG08_041415 [Elysia crispata]